MTAKPPLSRNFFPALLLALDLLILLVFFNFAYFLKYSTAHPSLLVTVEYFGFALVVALSAYTLGTYRPTASDTPGRMAVRFLIALIISGFVMVLIIYALGQPITRPYGRYIMLVTFGLFALWGVLSRLLFGSWTIKHSERQKWLVLGEPQDLQSFFKDSQDNGSREQFFYLANTELKSEGLKSYGTWGDLPKILKEESWTGVIVCPSPSYPQNLTDVLLQHKLKGLQVISALDYYESHWSMVPIYLLDTSSVTLAQGFGLTRGQARVRLKRGMDIALSLLLLPIAIPVFLTGALLVALESGFPVIYTQVRAGKNGKPFKIYKLRTMRQNAEKEGEIRFTAVNDDRVLKVGGFLRKFRFDESPQIINILKGEMSFIGPRPERVEIVEKYLGLIPFYGLRATLAPGLTGWAQTLRGYATEEGIGEKFQYDLYYIKNYSLLLDALILFRTARTIIFGTGR